MPNTIRLEVCVLVDASGDYAVGKDREEAVERYEETIQPTGDAGGLRFIDVTLTVPLPEAITVEVDVPEVEAAPTVRVA